MSGVFTAKLVEDIQRPECTSVVCSVMDEVIGPDVVPALGLQAYARSVIEPQPPFPRLFHRRLRPLAPPQAFNPLVQLASRRRAATQRYP